MAKLSNVSRARARTVRKGNARGSLTRTKRGTYMGLIKKKKTGSIFRRTIRALRAFRSCLSLGPVAIKKPFGSQRKKKQK